MNESGEKKSFYAVAVGRVPGIYKEWSECNQQVNGFSGGTHQKFKTLKAAQNFLLIDTL